MKGAEATVSRWSYEHVLDSGEVIPLMVQSILVFREPRVHTFYLVDSLDRPCIEQAVWDTFISSIRYSASEVQPG